MRILAIGDVCGIAGVDFLCKKLHSFKKQCNADFVIVNGENATGRGITPSLAEDIFVAGADVITLGNHAFDNRQILDYLDDGRDIIRPLNTPPQRPGNGYVVLHCMGMSLCVANLIGRVAMDYNCSSPFSAADTLLKDVSADAYIFDFHAESTSEKRAMAYHLDGRACVLFGTHTHIPTADEQVTQKGLGYITDLGMTGGCDSVIGVKAEQSLLHFRGGLAPRFEQSDRDLRIQGAYFDIEKNGRCTLVQRIECK